MKRALKKDAMKLLEEIFLICPQTDEKMSITDLRAEKGKTIITTAGKTTKYKHSINTEEI